MSKKADAMVVIPHPDDAEFEVGGTAARWIKEGKRVIYVVCTNGDKGTGDRSITPKQLAAVREAEQRDAAQLLGVHEVIFLRYPDQVLDDTPAFRKDIVRMIRMHRPDILVTSDPYHRYIYHRDHRIVGQVSLDAVYPYARDHLAYPDLMAEGLEPHKVKKMLFWASDDINLRSDITDTFDSKIAALRCHKSQMSMYPAPLLEDYLKERSREFAEGENYELAEAFHLVNVPG